MQFAMLLLTVLCQALTLVIAWPAWDVRTEPALLPLFDWTAWPLSFGGLLLGSLPAVLLWPRWGWMLHAALYAAACCADMHRLQPQTISLIVLMAGCTSRAGAYYNRHYLAALWLWAGLHKLVSPEWYGWSAWAYLDECGLPADFLAEPFAWLVALGEIALALCAIGRPRWAAWGCVVTHVAILVSLSPLGRNFNPSVWPWNFAALTVGAWLIARSAAPEEVATGATGAGWSSRVPAIVVAVTYLLPAGYYFDWVNPHFACVLYSGHMPRALHTGRTQVKRLDGWTGLAVPFPDSPWLFRRMFARTAQPGDKLHIWDPRWGFGDTWFRLSPSGEVEPIDAATFFSHRPGEPSGTAVDDPNAAWRMERFGAALEFAAGEVIAAVELRGAGPATAAVDSLALLPNLRELRLTGYDYSASDLRRLASLPQLEILELSGGSLGSEQFAELAQFSGLNWLTAEQAALNKGDLAALRSQPLQVLQLPKSRLEAGALQELGELKQLVRVDLSGARFPLSDAAALAKLTKCQWLTLSLTAVTERELDYLAPLVGLEILELRGLELSDEAIARLQSKLPQCRIER